MHIYNVLLHVTIQHNILTYSLNIIHGFASKYVLILLGRTLTKFVIIIVLSLYCMDVWIILCNFWLIVIKSSIKPLIRHHLYLSWRVPGMFHFFVDDMSLSNFIKYLYFSTNTIIPSELVFFIHSFVYLR